MNKIDTIQVGKKNIHEYSVGQIGREVRSLLEKTFEYIRVRGEITELMIARSGHMYMTLRDIDKEQATVRVVCWRSRVANLGYEPERGQDVTVTGRLTAYVGSSSYQLDIHAIEGSGIGALLQQLQALKKRLEGEGIFDSARKTVLPLLPRRLGVITSPFGAVIRDVLHRVADRCPCHVIIWPVAVQGAGSVEQIVEAIKGFNAAPRTWRPDVLIVARGGGSFQDLWGFNDERILRAAAESRIPIVSAIGHETDTPLLDFVADLRAPTPSAAAELVLPVQAGLVQRLAELRLSGQRIIGRRLQDGRQDVLRANDRMRYVTRRLRDLQENLDQTVWRLNRATEKKIERSRSSIARLKLISPRQSWQIRRQSLMQMTRSMTQAMQQTHLHQSGQFLNLKNRFNRLRPRYLVQSQQQLMQASRSLDQLSHEAQLRRGYALLFDGGRAVIRSVDQVTEGGKLCAVLAHKQEIYATVTGKRSGSDGKR